MKKPSASVTLYHQAATAHQLGKVEQLPATKQNWAEYERLRLLAWRLRKNAGFAWWVPVLVALALCLLFILWLVLNQPKGYVYSTPDRFQVIQRYDAYHYRLNHVGQGEFAVTFCQSYEPQLSAGQTLVWLAYLDRGKCWDIQPKGYGYRLLRDAQGRPILAPNCNAGPEVVVCSPNPTEARF